MHVPEWFEDALRKQFRGSYLIRWSNARQCYVIAEKVSVGHALPPHRLGEKLLKLKPEVREDYLWNLRNGTLDYVLIYPGNRAPCPSCGAKVLLRSREWIYARCGACQKDFNAVHYDLGELLLEQLRSLDIYEHSSIEEIEERQDRANLTKEQTDARDNKNCLEAAVKEDWMDLLGVDRSTKYERRT